MTYRKAAEEEKYSPAVQPRDKPAVNVGKVEGRWTPGGVKDEVGCFASSCSNLQIITLSNIIGRRTF